MSPNEPIWAHTIRFPFSNSLCKAPWPMVPNMWLPLLHHGFCCTSGASSCRWTHEALGIHWMHLSIDFVESICTSTCIFLSILSVKHLFFDIFWMPVWMMECLGTRHDRDDLPWSKKLHPPLSPIIGHWKSWRTCAFNTCWTHATPIRERERANENDMYCYWPYSSGPIPVISQ